MVTKKNFLRKSLTVKGFVLIVFSFLFIVSLLRMFTGFEIWELVTLCSLVGAIAMLVVDYILQKVDDESNDI